MVLGYGFWQEHFGGAESAVGSVLNLSGHPFQVIGVAAPGFFGVDVGKKFDVAVPICAEAIIRGKNSSLDVRAAWWLTIVGRPQAWGQSRAGYGAPSSDFSADVRGYRSGKLEIRFEEQFSERRSRSIFSWARASPMFAAPTINRCEC